MTERRRRNGKLLALLCCVGLFLLTTSQLKMSSLNKQFNSENYDNKEDIYIEGKVRRVSELDSLVDKLTLLLDNHSTSKNNPDSGTSLHLQPQEGESAKVDLEPPEPLILHQTNISARIWIDIPNDFPWRKCILDYGGNAATSQCLLEKDPGATWLITPWTPSLRIINTENYRCLEPASSIEGAQIHVKECGQGSWEYRSTGQLEWIDGGCASALGPNYGNKIILAQCDKEQFSQRFEFGLFDEKKSKISPFDHKDWERRQNNIRDANVYMAKMEVLESLKIEYNRTSTVLRRAAVFYLEKGDGNLAHLVWWVTAWKMLGLNSVEHKFDLVVFSHPEQINRLPSDCQEFSEETTSFSGAGQCLYVSLLGIAYRDSMYDNYINSHECLVNIKSEFLKHYSHILRSDLDTFPAPGIVDSWPSGILANKFMFYTFRNASGQSGITEAIEEAMNNLGYQHQNWHDIGSTWFGPSERILKLSKLTVALSKYLRFYMFGPGTPCRCATCVQLPKVCEWAGGGPYAGTLLLYSQEAAMNLIWTQEEFDAADEGYVDFGTTTTDSVCKKLQLHIFHSDNDFSKFKFIEGKYTDFDMTELDLTKTRDYALYLALRSAGQGSNQQIVDEKYSLGEDGSLAKVCQ